MKITFVLALFLFPFVSILSQSFQVMEENNNLISENLSASYDAQFVKNRKTQDVYDITVSIKNTGYDMYKFKESIGAVEYDLKKYALSEVKFDNATGSNLTSKGGQIIGKEFDQNISYECKDCSSEEDEKISQSKSMVIAYGLRRNQSQSESFRIRVPKGESPIVQIRFLNYN